MKEFKVEITETLQKTITIIASSEVAALEDAHSLYRDEEIVLDDSNYIDTKFKIIESEDN